MSEYINYRLEHDLLGERNVPEDAYWGIHTLRAVENFPITGTQLSIYPDLIVSLGLIKKSAALANRELGLLPTEKSEFIIQACEELISGKLHDQFIVDVIQGGAGTSTNMNANEVIANRALELAGQVKGNYLKIHPIEDVNRSQSTNDVYPTAIKLGLTFAIERLDLSLAALKCAYDRKSQEFGSILKIGRTQLQDAVPMTVGQEFSTYAVMIEEDQQRLNEAARLLLEINLGATAIGTGINSDPEYSQIVCQHLAELSGKQVVPAGNLIEATQDAGAFVTLSGTLKRIAVKLSKVCNDLRLLSSGPQAGLNELNLPARAAGSSIMPGKVNPIIPEVVNQVAFEVIGNDITVTMAAEGGQLQLNAFEPIIAHSLFKSILHMTAACETLRANCIEDITVNAEHLTRTVARSVSLITALNPYIGYENASRLSREALSSGRSVSELVLKYNLLTPEALDAILMPDILTSPRKMTVFPVK